MGCCTGHVEGERLTGNKGRRERERESRASSLKPLITIMCIFSMALPLENGDEDEEGFRAVGLERELKRGEDVGNVER